MNLLGTSFRKTARDPHAPLAPEPIGRLGALVFQPDGMEKSEWADPQRSDPDSRLWQDDNKSWRTRGWKNVDHKEETK